MKSFSTHPKLFAPLALLALAGSPTAWAYDSSVNGGIGLYTLRYEDQAQSMKKRISGWRLGYIGRFNENLGFEVRMGGTGEASVGNLKIHPGLFLSPLFRPSLPIGETVELHAVIGFTSLAVGRTAGNNVQEVIGRSGGSIGLGADFRINEHMAAGFEWISYQRNVDFGPNANETSWTGVTRAKVSLCSLTANFKYRF